MHLAYDGSVELTMVTKQQPGVEVKLTLRLSSGQDQIVRQASVHAQAHKTMTNARAFHLQLQSFELRCWLMI